MNIFTYVNSKFNNLKSNMKKHYDGYHFIIQWLLMILIITIIYKIIDGIFTSPKMRIPDTPLSKISYSIPTQQTISLFSENAPNLPNQFKVTPLDLPIKKTIAPPLGLFLNDK